MDRFTEELVEAGVFVAAAGLKNSAQAKRVVFDGPGRSTVTRDASTFERNVTNGAPLPCNRPSRLTRADASLRVRSQPSGSGVDTALAALQMPA
jgi:hypothetical protein